MKIAPRKEIPPFPPRRGARPGGFSLVELLTAVAMVALLAALALPALEKGYRQSQKQACLAHLHQLFGLVLLYAGDNDGLVVHNIAVNNSGTWADTLRPYAGISDSFAVGRRPVSIFACPSSQLLVSKSDKSDYGKNISVNKQPESGTQYRLGTVARPGGILALGDATLRDLSCSAPLANFAARHDGRANVVYFDGHAESLDPDTLSYKSGVPPWSPQ